MSPAMQTQPLSMMPSQSSSMLLQVSVAGFTPPAHAPQRPFTQVSVPGRQIPTVARPHDRVVPSRQSHPSSTIPSQSSSPPLQSSVAGPIAPRHVAPHARRAGLGAGPALADAAAARPRDAVDDAVAVVVGAVAGFAPGHRQPLSLARSESRHARLDDTGCAARPADADARGRGRAVVAGARLAAAADAAVVDDAVAVVVQFVARLGAGQPPATTRTPVAADAARARDACLRAVGAHADAACAGGSVVAGARRARGAVAAVVDGAVAIVVEAIAELGTGQRLSLARPPLGAVRLGHAVLPPRRARSHALRSGGAAVAGAAVARLARAAVVDGSVAVVVQPVAQVAVGPDVPFARAPEASDAAGAAEADLHPVTAGSDAAGPGRPRVARALRADLAQAPVVDPAVAVVVEPVARLRLRRHRVRAQPPAAELGIAGAHLLARGAGADTGEARRSWITVLRRALRADATFVHPTVAVVVQPVAAHLDGGGRPFDREIGYVDGVHPRVGGRQHRRVVALTLLGLGARRAGRPDRDDAQHDQIANGDHQHLQARGESYNRTGRSNRLLRAVRWITRGGWAKLR